MLLVWVMFVCHSMTGAVEALCLSNVFHCEDGTVVTPEPISDVRGNERCILTGPQSLRSPLQGEDSSLSSSDFIKERLV